MIVRVAHADVVFDIGFPRSIQHWQNEGFQQHAWKVASAQREDITLRKGESLIVEGNCTQGVSAPEGGIVHIYGDLASHVEIFGFAEIVITGDLRPEARIVTSGFSHVFVGGSVLGEVRSADSLYLWIEGDFSGAVKTGKPATHIHVGHDYRGAISPAENASLLWLSVSGFAAQAALAGIVNFQYAQFHATIARSDAPPGIYPTIGGLGKTLGGIADNRWCVLAEGRA